MPLPCPSLFAIQAGQTDSTGPKREPTVRTEGDISRSNEAALAQFFTPSRIAEFMWESVREYTRLEREIRVIDPAAGDGAFLRAVIDSRTIEPIDLHGVELDGALAVELGTDDVLSPAGTKIHHGNGLHYEGETPWRGSFDVVLGNPPFGRLGAHPAGCSGGSVNPGHMKRPSPLQKLVGGKPGKMPLELLFLERALDLAKPGGIISFILPQGFFTNQRLQPARAWVTTQAQVRAVIDLPGEVFRKPGLNAMTGILLLRKTDSDRDSLAPLLFGAMGYESLAEYLDTASRAVRLHSRGKSVARISNANLPAENELACDRWDSAYWREKKRDRPRRGVPFVPLGDFITHLTYGPIVTGRKPGHHEGGVPVIYQGNVTETGVSLNDPLCVPEDSKFDPPRSRVRKRDLLLPRSGVGTLGRNRMAVYCDDVRANVGCFVDIVRLEGVNPFYVWFYFKTESGLRQISAVINGVGTPNINFTEIRDLQVALVSDDCQRHVEEEYWDRVLPLHREREEDAAKGGECDRRFRQIVEAVSAWLR